MPTDENLKIVAAQINKADKPEDVFGLIVSPDVPGAEKALSKLYHKLVRFVVPDLYRDPADNKLATEAFKKLSELKEAAIARIKAGIYGKEDPPVVLNSQGKSYKLGKVFARGAIANLYVSEDKIVKICGQQADNDLMMAEKDTLDAVRKSLDVPNGKPWLTVLPEISHSFQVDHKASKHRVNVMNRFEDTLNLVQVKNKIGRIDGRTSVWMFKRVIHLLPWVHGAGYVHGALLPPHLLVRPDNFNDNKKDPLKHAVMVVDWCYSRPVNNKLVAWDAQYQAFYPPEVTKKQAFGPSGDIYMLGKTMLYMIGGDVNTNEFPADYPAKLKEVLERCLQSAPASRATAKQLFEDMIAASEAVYGPRKWHDFIVDK